MFTFRQTCNVFGLNLYFNFKVCHNVGLHSAHAFLILL